MQLGESCDHSKLTQRQATAVAAVQHEHDLRNCLHGWTCDQSSLNPAEVKAVAAAELERNLSIRLHEWMDGCDMSQLSAREAAKVKAEIYQRNYVACVTAESTCDRSRLTSADNKRIKSQRNP